MTSKNILFQVGLQSKIFDGFVMKKKKTARFLCHISVRNNNWAHEISRFPERWWVILYYEYLSTQLICISKQKKLYFIRDEADFKVGRLVFFFVWWMGSLQRLSNILTHFIFLPPLVWLLCDISVWLHRFLEKIYVELISSFHHNRRHHHHDLRKKRARECRLELVKTNQVHVNSSFALQEAGKAHIKDVLYWRKKNNNKKP